MIEQPSVGIDMAHPILKTAISVLILVVGLSCAWWSFIVPDRCVSTARRAIGSNRPGRRLGAVICLLLSIMFVVGAHGIDVPDHWRSYAAFWILMLILLLWLCGLALRDLWHTRRLLADHRSGVSLFAGSRAAASSEKPRP